MLKIAFHKRLGGWQRPEIMPMENLVLHPAAKVFHYALEVSLGFQSGECVREMERDEEKIKERIREREF